MGLSSGGGFPRHQRFRCYPPVIPHPQQQQPVHAIAFSYPGQNESEDPADDEECEGVEAGTEDGEQVEAAAELDRVVDAFAQQQTAQFTE